MRADALPCRVCVSVCVCVCVCVIPGPGKGESDVRLHHMPDADNADSADNADGADSADSAGRDVRGAVHRRGLCDGATLDR
jgi:hypothetical protein